jgi:cellulose synthase/poly-beta-1,6-N-acetylglucosamine synthase-like glycosyltransferase
VYVPKILARGLTPVDWRGYLVQQRRWARSVLDVKFRNFPVLARTLPWTDRLLGFLHGIYYVRSSLAVLGLVILAFVLLTGNAPVVVSPGLSGPLVALFLAMWLTDAYRQRFFFDRAEWGLHWRAAVLEFAKWPYFVLALGDVLRGFNGPYAITRKIRGESTRRMLLVPHALTAGVVAGTWIAGVLLGRAPGPVVQLCGALAAIGSLGVIATERVSFPAPYDADLAATWSVQAVESTALRER